jgi:ubiquinol-cytochrome c reductase cytochrome c1 subunit
MAHYESEVPHLHWPHHGFMEGLDWRSVRRGREVFEQVLAPCHSLQFMKFRHFEAFMSKDEVKEWAASIEIDDTPDETGEARKRTAKRFDSLPDPYKNEQAARFANSGALPPDLSLITNARHGGVNYIYALLTSYGRPVPVGIALSPGQFFNPYFPGGIIGMPPPLSDDMIEYEDGTPASVHQMAKDIAMFLEFCSNPWWDERKLLGCKFMSTVAALGVTASWYNRFQTNHVRSRRVLFRGLKYAAK